MTESTGSVRPPTRLVIFDYGFRPFFFGAGAWAAIAVAIWLAMLSGRIESPSALDPMVWHVHEMVFGFAAAAIGGFILTAVPNWTGRAPVAGGLLAGLVAAWLAGRVAVLWSASIGAEAAAVLDLLYLAALCAVAAREIVAGGNKRNLPIAVVIGLLGVCNLLVHLEQLGAGETAAIGNRLGIAVILLLVTVIGGRITPAFTRNWLRGHGDDADPRGPGWPDRAAIATTALTGLSWGIAPDWPGTGVFAIAAAVAHAVRLAGWRGHRTLAEPLLSILHVGCLWLVVGFALLGASVFVAALPQSAALHALTAGAVGTMTLAVMTRASLGHSGRELRAGAGTMIVYALVTLAALARVLSPAVAGAESDMLVLSGALWIAAFGLFAVLYAPVLLLAAPNAED